MEKQNRDVDAAVDRLPQRRLDVDEVLEALGRDVEFGIGIPVDLARLPEARLADVDDAEQLLGRGDLRRRRLVQWPVVVQKRLRHRVDLPAVCLVGLTAVGLGPLEDFLRGLRLVFLRSPGNDLDESLVAERLEDAIDTGLRDSGRLRQVRRRRPAQTQELIEGGPLVLLQF